MERCGGGGRGGDEDPPYRNGTSANPAPGEAHGAIPTDGRPATGDAAEDSRIRKARRYFRTVPPYRVQFERDGSVKLCRKTYRYWAERSIAEATDWTPISIHQSLEQAEQRLRHITAPHVYYDEHGRLARAPEPTEEERAAPCDLSEDEED